jgi:ABC-type glycerol-3-phosphate transport system permease component
MDRQISMPVKQEGLAVPFWRRKSFLQTTHTLMVYIFVIGLSILVMMPLGWMLTAALKPTGNMVYTLPPQWFPTEYFHAENFWLVLINKQFPL